MFVRCCLALGLLALAACETVEGMGRDVQTAGQVIERESYRARN